MTFVVDGTVAALVAIIVQVLLKPLLEIWLKPDAPNHDTAVRAMALVLGVLLLALDTLIGGPWPATGNAWLLLIGSGALSGVSAVGAYHIFSGSASPTVVASGATGLLPAGAANSALDLPSAAPAHPDHTFTYTFPSAGTSAPAPPASDTAHVTVSTPTSVTTETIPVPPSPSPEPPATADRPAQPPSA